MINKKRKKILCSLISSALLFGLAGQVSAEETVQEEFSLDEYVVTANRMPVKATEVAANVIVVNREEIERGNYASVPEILRKVNIAVEEGAGGAIPILNGDKRVLILVDGRRMNWDQIITSGSAGGYNLTNIPVKNIERIEIVHGPSSSLYGSDAVGGVINIITRKATGENTTITTEAGSWGQRRYAFSTENKLDNGFSYFITAERKKQDNYKYKDEDGHTNEFPQTYGEQDSLTFRLDKELDNERSLSLQVDYVDQDGGFGMMAPGYTYHYPYGYGSSQDNNIALTYNLSKDSFFRIYRNSSSNEVSYNGSTIGYEVDRSAVGMEWQQRMQLNDQHTLVGGVDWRQNDFEYVSQNIDDSYTTKAIYLEDNWKLPHDWTLTLGSRYDDHSIIGNHVTSRVTANRKLNEKTNVFASWGQFVKSPTVEDLFSDTQWFRGNPNLRPETGDTITLGMNTKFDQDTNLQLSVFKSRVEDAIAYDYSTTPGFAYNIDEQKRRGLDLTLAHKLSDQWSVSAGYSYVKVENKDASTGATGFTNDPDNSQPNGYRFNVQYTQDQWDAGLTLRAASGRDADAFGSRHYTVLDMAVNYQIKPETKLYLKGYNLTNEAYSLKGIGDWGTGLAYPMTKRNFVFGMEQRI
ncbi:hypothetical protein P22_3962 [Propionispora sp. 2/2-37]|uniref:TonB-dependent receptor plug domain-containing protein n=1 Tax=Propionispora sp. 2/2-37 TaxID=1677858 RepID=UPI0006BF761E|nr:TonB-dependent receptor [Propionispora sp. 2/2-37]CUH97816.1 hypothetical protein P22_3962 [Propionispora sp. 2/2-37]